VTVIVKIKLKGKNAAQKNWVICNGGGSGIVRSLYFVNNASGKSFAIAWDIT